MRKDPGEEMPRLNWEKADILGPGQTGGCDICDTVGYLYQCACVEKHSHVPMFMDMQHS